MRFFLWLFLHVPLIPFALVLSPAFAGNEVGHGGWGCRLDARETSSAEKIELMDFFEAAISDNYVYEQTELIGDISAETRRFPDVKMRLITERLDKVYGLLETVYPSYFQGIRKTLNLVLTHYELLPPTAAPYVNRMDFKPRVACESPVNLAFNPNASPVDMTLNEANYQNIHLRTRYIQQMQLLHVAGLFSHEVLAIWTAQKSKGGATTTNLARLINSKAFAVLFGETPLLDAKGFAEWLQLELGTNWTDKAPARCMIYDAQMRFRGLAMQPVGEGSSNFPLLYADILSATQDDRKQWHWRFRARYTRFLKDPVKDTKNFGPERGSVTIQIPNAPLYYINPYLAQRTMPYEIGQITPDGNIYSSTGKQVGSLLVRDSTIRNSANAVVGHFRGCRTVGNTYFLPRQEDYFEREYPTPLARAAAAAFALLFVSWDQTMSGSGGSRELAASSARVFATEACSTEKKLPYEPLVLNVATKQISSSGLFMTRAPVYSATASFICIPK